MRIYELVAVPVRPQLDPCHPRLVGDCRILLLLRERRPQQSNSVCVVSLQNYLGKIQPGGKEGAGAIFGASGCGRILQCELEITAACRAESSVLVCACALGNRREAFQAVFPVVDTAMRRAPR